MAMSCSTAMKYLALLEHLKSALKLLLPAELVIEQGQMSGWPSSTILGLVRILVKLPLAALFIAYLAHGTCYRYEFPLLSVLLGSEDALDVIW